MADPPLYSFEYPADWTEEIPTKTEKSTMVSALLSAHCCRQLFTAAAMPASLQPEVLLQSVPVCCSAGLLRLLAGAGHGWARDAPQHQEGAGLRGGTRR
jgi:hypothetical protein